MAGTVLLVEDEPSVGELVRGYLSRDGYRVIWVRNGEDALVEIARHPVRLVLLDIGLPGKDGFDVCREIRARSHVPILMLTARDEEPDRIVGLEVGADDYVTKPFSPRELVARMKAVLPAERAARPARHRSTLGDVVLDRESHDVTVAGKPVELTAKEFDLLAYFLANTGAVPLARPAARPRLGPRVPRRHANRRRSRRAAAPQARSPGSDPHAARRRVQGRRAVRQPAGAALRGDARRARTDPALTIGIGAVLTRRQVDRIAGAALAHAPTTSRSSGGAARSYINQNTARRATSGSSCSRARCSRSTSRTSTLERRQHDLRGRELLYSYRTIPSRGLLLLRPRACARPRGTRSCATCCSPRCRRCACGGAVVRARPLDRAADPPCRRGDPRARGRRAARAAAPDRDARGCLARAGVQRDGRAARGLARRRAQLPALGQPRAEDAADRDPRLRRRTGRRRVRADEAARAISLEAGRLERLVHDLLDLARMNRSEFSVRREPSTSLRSRARRSPPRGGGAGASGSTLDATAGRAGSRPTTTGCCRSRRTWSRTRSARHRAAVASPSRPSRRCSASPTPARASRPRTCRMRSTASTSTTSSAATGRSAAGSGWRSSSSSRRRWAGTSSVESSPGGRDLRGAATAAASRCRRPRSRSRAARLARAAGRSTSAGSARPRCTRASRCRPGSSRTSSSPARRCAPAVAASRCRRWPSAAPAVPSAAATDRVELLASWRAG